MPTLTRPIAFIDVESTGVDVVNDRIVEFGASILRPDGSRTPWVQRFNPGIPIPAAATEVHGITDADVDTCPKFSDWATRLAAALAGKDLAGYNLRRMDLPMLDEEFRRCGMNLNLDGVRIIDCFGIFSKKEPRKLEDAVRRYCGREHDGAHGAGADAVATVDVFLGQMDAYPELGAMPLEEVAAYSLVGDVKYADIAAKLYFDADGDVCYAFGKYKDRKVIEEWGYAEWMLSRDFPGSTCDVLRAELDKLQARAEWVAGA
jgi:DNA polymerase-3 subunit epsilon